MPQRHQPFTELHGGRPSSDKNDALEILETEFKKLLTETEHQVSKETYDALMTFFEVRVPQLFGEIRYLRDEFFKYRKMHQYFPKKEICPPLDSEKIRSS